MTIPANVLLVHGMGRTPLSMALLAYRLKKAGHTVATFGYSAAMEAHGPCLDRLENRINGDLIGNGPYILVGHSLGAVIIRSILPRLQQRPPAACFFLAPPNRSPRLARRLASNPIYRALTGEMGQLLADRAFMDELPIPAVPTTVFAGDRGYQGRFSPFHEEANDGVVSVEETRFSDTHSVVRLPVLHTFIMNNRRVADEITRAALAAAEATS